MWRLLLVLGHLSLANGANNTVFWYLGSYDETYVEQNRAFLTSARSEVDGVLHCCTGPTVDANGTFIPGNTTRFGDLTKFETEMDLSPVMLPLSPNTDAVLQRVAAKAVPDLVAFAITLGLTGFVVDYEPHDQTTKEHAEAFASFLTALAQALHAKSLKLAVCVSDWGILDHYKILATANADWFVSMGSTYFGKSLLTDKFNVGLMKDAFSTSQIVVGIGSMAPSSCTQLTDNYAWTQSTLSSFLDWVKDQGITQLAVWRADIYPKYCGIEPWFASTIQGFKTQN